MNRSKIAECQDCGREVSRLYVCCECGRLVCDLCYVEAVDICTDCEETWQTEGDLDFIEEFWKNCIGYASGKEIQEMIQTINLKELMPIHTKHPELFEKIHGNVKKPKLEEF